MLSTPTRERVTRHTSDEINARIERDTRASVAYFRAHPDEIDERLEELDEEWDIERALEANAAGAVMFGLAMTLLGGRRWFVLPAAVSGFLMQHAVQGWCPPLPVLRRLGFRTAQEIEEERNALLALREARPLRARPARGKPDAA